MKLAGLGTDWNQWSYLNMTRGWRLEGERDIADFILGDGSTVQVAGPPSFLLHDLPVPDHQTAHDIMIRRGDRTRVPLADWVRGRGWRMSCIPLTEAEAGAIAGGTDPLTLLAGPRVRLEIVRESWA